MPGSFERLGRSGRFTESPCGFGRLEPLFELPHQALRPRGIPRFAGRERLGGGGLGGLRSSKKRDAAVRTGHQVTRQRPAGPTAQRTAACWTGSSVARRRALGSRAASSAGFGAPARRSRAYSV